MTDASNSSVYVEDVRQASADYRTIIEIREITKELHELRKFLWFRHFMVAPIAYLAKVAIAAYVALTILAWAADENARKKNDSAPAPVSNPARGGAGNTPPPFGAKADVPAPATGPLVPYQGKLPDGGMDNVKPTVPPNNPATQKSTVPPDNPMKQLPTIRPANPTIPPIGPDTPPGIPPIGCATPPGVPPAGGASTTRILTKGV